MTTLLEQRVRQLERLCGQLLAQNHRLIERNAKLMMEIQALHREDRMTLSLNNVARIPLSPRLHPVR